MDQYLFNLINLVKDFLFSFVKSFDIFIFNGVNQFALRWDWLDTLGIVLANYLPYILLLSLLVFLIVNVKKYLRMIIQSVLAGVLARFGIVGLIRWLLPRARPFVNNDINLLFEHNTSSFPSGHAAVFFAISTIVFYYNKRIGILFFLVSILIILARVFSGIHWPSDILAGAVVGIFSGWLIHRIFTKD